MQLTYYNHYDRDADTRDYVLGIITDDTKFIDMYIDGVINSEFLDVVYSEKSFSVEVDAGTATFRKENKKYWYAYKKLKGKLNKAYVGTTQLLTELAICKAVEEVNTPKEPTSSTVTQNDSVTALQEVHKIGDRIDASIPDELPPDWNAEAEQWKRIAACHEASCDHAWDKVAELEAEIEKLKAIANPTISLAGNGKNENHLQPNVIDCFESLAIAQNEITILNKMVKDAQDDLKAANEKEHEQWKEVQKLKASNEKLLQVNNEAIQQLAANSKILHERELELTHTQYKLLGNIEEIESLKQVIDAGNSFIRAKLSFIKELENNVDLIGSQFDYLHERGNAFKELHNEALQRIHQLEFFLSEKNEIIENLQEYNRVGEQEAFQNLNTFEAVMPVIHQYRVMADGKTKKANPRYAYLLDFLAEIDKIS